MLGAVEDARVLSLVLEHLKSRDYWEVVCAHQKMHVRYNNVGNITRASVRVIRHHVRRAPFVRKAQRVVCLGKGWLEA
jgi:hypothetical protein